MGRPFLYFAYGSNMDPDRLGARCPSAEMFFLARLDGYKFLMTRKRRSGYGAADIVEAPDSCVYGVVYTIPREKDRRQLRQAEGCCADPKAYCEICVTVTDCGTGQQANVKTFTVCDKHESPVLTTREYREHVLRGARIRQLPEWYIEKLSQKIVISEHSE